MSEPEKVGTCYCGCGETTKGHFADSGGHDAKAASMLHFVTWGTTNMAAILRDFGYGPGPNDKNLEADARARAGSRRASDERGCVQEPAVAIESDI
jgi:hypothetical protein